MQFTKEDIQQFEAKGISQTVVLQQIENFKKGFPFAANKKAATIGDGILRIEGEALIDYIKLYETQSPALKIYKFVPASGAASRMFKALFACMNTYKGSAEEIAAMATDQSLHSLYTFFSRLEDFAFYEDLKAALAKNGEDINTLAKNKDYAKILTALLTEEGLNYGKLPKGLLKFHKNGKTTRTPLEEHLVEGAKYCKNADGKVYLHFTVSQQHKALFLALINEVKADYEKALDCTFEISLSEQAAYTDTIAVDMNNVPFREEDGTILFRPGGHGALIENVNALDGDIVFLKNIDNVVPDRLKDETYTYKKLIGGVLLSIQAKIFDYLAQLSTPTPELIEKVTTFVTNDLASELTAGFDQKSMSEKTMYLFDKLNRPIRICGMVKNEGEPGGGPFWTVNADGSTSLQIIESAQINKTNAEQLSIMKNSSHFNPVDVVCSLKDHNGEKFDLLNYRDENTGFIAYKSKNGRELKAQELPGLWNGAMADTTTLFVEVPAITFNPVKVVNDLLRPQHQ